MSCPVFAFHISSCATLEHSASMILPRKPKETEQVLEQMGQFRPHYRRLKETKIQSCIEPKQFLELLTFTKGHVSKVKGKDLHKACSLAIKGFIFYGRKHASIKFIFILGYSMNLGVNCTVTEWCNWLAKFTGNFYSQSNPRKCYTNVHF